MQRSNLSVIIPTFSEAEFIGKTLTCLSKINAGLEIIVVDSGSQDETVETARRFADMVFVIPERGISKAKNFGATHATSGTLVFIDADVIVPLDFAEKVKGAVKDGVTGATCHILPFKARLRDQFFSSPTT